MTDTQVLYSYRIGQAEETLADAERMFSENLTSRSILIVPTLERGNDLNSPAIYCRGVGTMFVFI